ncbi:MAG TPA: FAD-dependent oxidoreductase [Candidatus Limnocylindrales bacterium]|nr:FAD-dependent oxidoreductase [Candidatus Limnocylindrales bacterium]
MTVDPSAAGRDAVLGAGALGLTVALRLAQAGRSVTVFEREPLPGGLAAGFEVAPGIWLEKFYHHLFRSDRQAIALIEELGLGDELKWHRPITATLRDGRRWQLDSPLSLLRFGPLPLPDRLRMGVVLAGLRALPRPSPLEGRTAQAWIRRWMGSAAERVVWGPLLEGKFGAAAPEIALPWFWARVHDRTPELGYLRGGFQQVYAALAKAVEAAGGELRFGTAVERVEPAGGASVAGSAGGSGSSADGGGSSGFVVRLTDGSSSGFARVVSTLPTRLTARLVPALPDGWRARYDWGRAYGAHCLILALDRPLTGDIYWLNVNDPGYPFMALVEHTNLRPPAEYGGRHLVYLGNYRPMDDPIFSRLKDDLVAEAAAALTRLAPDFGPERIVESWAFAAPFAQPIVTTDYRQHIPPFATPLAGLSLANMFQVYPHDRGQNYSIALAERLAARLTYEAGARSRIPRLT